MYQLCSYPRFIICNPPSKKPVPVRDIIPVRVIFGISRMAKLWPQRKKRQYVRNLAHCFNGREWICYLRSSLVNSLYQCQNQCIRQQKFVCIPFIFFLFYILILYLILLILIISATEIKQEVKTEKKDMKPPPEKKPRVS